MKFRLLTSVAALSLGCAVSPHAFAAASPVTQVGHDVSSSFPDANPCTWAPGVSTTTATTLFHVTVRPNQSVSVTGTNTGTITFVPADSMQPTYTGHFAQTFGGSGTLDASTGELVVGEETSTYTVHASGSDGTSITYHEVSHATVNPNGTVTVTFDRPTASCG